MGSLAATYLQDIRSLYPSNLDRDQLRVTRTGLLTSVLDMTNSPDSIVSASLKRDAISSQGRVLDIPIMKKGSVTINNSRSCSVVCGQSDSDLVTVIWKTASVDVCMVPSQYEVNEIGYTLDFAKKIRERVEALKIVIEQDLETALDTNKNQVWNSSIVTDKYTPVGNTLRVSAGDRSTFFNDLDAINFSDDFYNENIKIIASPSMMSDVNYYINQGAGNSANLSYQFAGKDYTFSNRVLNGVGVSSTGYFMPNGTVGLLSRVDVDARMRNSATDGTDWFVDTLPDFPFAVGVQYKSQCSDQSTLETSGLGHLTATKVEHYQFSFDYAIITPAVGNIATDSVAIRKFEFLS